MMEDRERIRHSLELFRVTAFKIFKGKKCTEVRCDNSNTNKLFFSERGR
jgi:hypothetical protein